ncbi:MAG TPA: hypothetical protein PLA74_09360, partial [Syntrophales bacterium]|nr:hypothetical protein [Syntrophales bacterium]
MNKSCPICGSTLWTTVFQYDAPPEGEVKFDFSKTGAYSRTVSRCGVCGHYVSRHSMDDSSLYSGQYVDATYGDAEGLLKTFNKIISLDSSKSDNSGRVKRVNEFAVSRIGDVMKKRVLDVGSGLCVFLHGMKAVGWECVALDP